MSDLVEFLRARLDEDEQVAKDAAAAYCGPGEDAGPVGQAWTYSDSSVWGVDPAGHVASAQASSALPRHLARWDPARVLAEVAAKRAMIDALQGYEPSEQWHDIADMGKRENNAAGTLRRMAQVYADHPDFDPAWRLTPA